MLLILCGYGHGFTIHTHKTCIKMSIYCGVTAHKVSNCTNDGIRSLCTIYTRSVGRIISLLVVFFYAIFINNVNTSHNHINIPYESITMRKRYKTDSNTKRTQADDLLCSRV